MSIDDGETQRYKMDTPRRDKEPREPTSCKFQHQRKSAGSRKSSRSGSGSESEKYKKRYHQSILEQAELKKKMELMESQLKHVAEKGRETGVAWEYERAIRLDSESQRAAEAASAAEKIQQTANALFISEKEKRELWEQSAFQSEQASMALQAAFAEIQQLRGDSASIMHANLTEFEKHKSAANNLEEGVIARDQYISQLIQVIDANAEQQREHVGRTQAAEKQFNELKKLFSDRTADMTKTITDSQSDLRTSRTKMKEMSSEIEKSKKKIEELEALNATMITMSQFEMYVDQFVAKGEKLKGTNESQLIEISTLNKLVESLKIEIKEAKAAADMQSSGSPPRMPTAGARPGAAEGIPGEKTGAINKASIARKTETFCQDLINRVTGSNQSDNGSGSEAEDFASAEDERKTELRPNLDARAVPATPAVHRSTESVASDTNSHLTLLERGNKGTKASEIKVPKYPRFAELDIWLNKLSRNIWASSENPGDMAEIAWLLEVKEKSFEELGSSGEERFTTMDALLVIALEKTLPPDMNRVYTQRCHDAIKEKKIVLGRQLVWLILNSFKTADHMSLVYSYDNLMSMEWYGDNNIEEFLTSWHRMVDNLAVEPKMTPASLRDILHRKMSDGKSKLFADDLKYYNREKGKSQIDGAPQREDYSYDFLLSIMNREIRQRAEDKVVEARKRSTRMQGRGNNRDNREEPAAPAPKAKAKAKAEAKAKAPRDTSRKPKAGREPRSGGTPRSPKGTPRGGRSPSPKDRKSPGDTPCYKYHTNLHDGSLPKCTFENCKFKHGNKMSKDDVAKLKKPQARSRSPSAKRGVDPSLGGKDWYTNAQGEKLPKHCGAFLAGNCSFEKDKGKKCRFPHLTQQQYDKALKALRS